MEDTEFDIRKIYEIPKDYKNFEEYESKIKNKLFSNIQQTIASMTELQIGAKKLNLNKPLPNIGITLNNKLREISKEFEECGVSMHAKQVDKYLMPSMLGEAIEQDLLLEVARGANNLKSFGEIIKIANDRKSKELAKTKKVGPISKVLNKIKEAFNIKKEKSDFTEQELEEIDKYIDTYNEIDSNLWEYNFRDNLPRCIVKHLKENVCNHDSIPYMLFEIINPDLRKLGLEKAIPQVERELLQKGKKDFVQKTKIEYEQINKNNAVNKQMDDPQEKEK